VVKKNIRGEKIDNRGRNTIKKRQGLFQPCLFRGKILIPALPVSSAAAPLQPSMQIFIQIRNYPYCSPPHNCFRRFALSGETNLQPVTFELNPN
jgi:hypothetical protein